MKQLVVVLCVIAGIFWSCSKGSDSPGDTNNDKAYIGRWPFQSKVNWHTSGGTLYKDTIYGRTGEYIDFKADGTVTQCYYDNLNDLQTYTLNYQVIDGVLYCNDFPNGSKLTVSGSSLTIDASDPSNVESLWWHFKK